jgi:GntR family transcriptional regulator
MIARSLRRASAGVVLHHQFYVMLRERLLEGTYQVGRPLPSEPKLADEFGVSRTTVRRALARLEEEQLIVRRHGSGTFPLRAQRSHAIREQVISLFDNLATVHKTTTTRLARFARVAPPAFITDRFPAFGSPCRLVLRTRSFAGAPFALLTSYVRESIGSRLDRERLGHKPLTAVLEELNEPAAKAEQAIAAVAAAPVAANYLNVAVGTPLLAVRTHLLDDGGALLAHLEALYIPDFYEYRVSMERSEAGPWTSDDVPTPR